jgi:hypothetical protein
MVPAIIICVVLAILLPILLGFVPPPHANILVRIKAGSLQVKRGSVRAHAREHIEEILREAAVSSGFIAVTPGNRVTFSRQIPQAIHQRLRNVLLNQWA